MSKIIKNAKLNSDLNSNYLLSSMYSFYRNKKIIKNTYVVPQGKKNCSAYTLNNNLKGKKAKKIHGNFYDFLNFMKIFTEVYYNNYYHLKSLVLEFKKDRPDLKEVYAELISDKYKKLISEIKKMKPPAFIKPSHKIYLDSLEKYKMFYCLYNDYTNNNEILEIIENEAVSLENKFWRRIHKINSFFNNSINKSSL